MSAPLTLPRLAAMEQAWRQGLCLCRDDAETLALIAAARRGLAADGLIERAREIANRHWNTYGEQERMWQEAHDLAIAIAALNAEAS